jgi:L-aminopeptidase/D-esterase-like protein
MRGGRRLGGAAVIVRQGLRFWYGEQLARSRKVFRAGRLGQKSVVTNAMEALRQDVAEEAADKLTRCERHDFLARSAARTIILVVECDAVLVERKQSAIGDGNAVGIARQIGKNRLGSAERTL